MRFGPRPARDMATFQKLFCADYRCSEEEFVNRLLGRCLHGKAGLLRPVLSRIRPDYFAADKELVSAIAQCSRLAQVEAEIGDFVADHRNASWLRGGLRVRISTRSLRSLARSCLGPKLQPRPVGVAK